MCKGIKKFVSRKGPCLVRHDRKMRFYRKQIEMFGCTVFFVRYFVDSEQRMLKLNKWGKDWGKINGKIFDGIKLLRNLE